MGSERSFKDTEGRRHTVQSISSENDHGILVDQTIQYKSVNWIDDRHRNAFVKSLKPGDYVRAWHNKKQSEKWGMVSALKKDKKGVTGVGIHFEDNSWLCDNPIKWILAREENAFKLHCKDKRQSQAVKIEIAKHRHPAHKGNWKDGWITLF